MICKQCKTDADFLLGQIDAKNKINAECRHLIEIQRRRIITQRDELDYKERVLQAAAFNVDAKQGIIDRLIADNRLLADKSAQLEAGIQNLLESEIRQQVD